MKVQSSVDIIRSIIDPQIFGSAFGDLGTWRGWLTIFRSIFALPFEDGDLEFFRDHTGWVRPPSKPVRECFILAGRRSGKSFCASVLAVFCAVFFDFKPFLRRGERPVIMILSVDRSQSTVILNYIRGLLELPLFKDLVDKETQQQITLKNGVTLEIHASNFRAIRGRSVAVALLDEICFWRSEDSANPDLETYRSLVPALASFPNSLLVAISSPYSKTGLAYRKWKEHFGNPNPRTLVFQAATRGLNPTISQELVDSELASDPVAASAEFLGLWREDIAEFVLRETVQSCVVPGRRVLPPVAGAEYRAFLDCAGGGNDEYAGAIGHLGANGKVVVDFLQGERGNPVQLTEHFSQVFKTYGLWRATSDRYAADWPKETFRRLGIELVASELSKSDLYVQALPILQAGEIELLDNPALVSQFANLERRTGSSGREVIDHPRVGRVRAHDDLANCIAGLAVELRKLATAPQHWEVRGTKPIWREYFPEWL